MKVIRIYVSSVLVVFQDLRVLSPRRFISSDTGFQNLPVQACLEVITILSVSQFRVRAWITHVGSVVLVLSLDLTPRVNALFHQADFDATIVLCKLVRVSKLFQFSVEAVIEVGPEVDMFTDGLDSGVDSETNGFNCVGRFPANLELLQSSCAGQLLAST